MIQIVLTKRLIELKLDSCRQSGDEGRLVDGGAKDGGKRVQTLLLDGDDGGYGWRDGFTVLVEIQTSEYGGEDRRRDTGSGLGTEQGTRTGDDRRLGSNRRW